MPPRRIYRLNRRFTASQRGFEHGVLTFVRSVKQSRQQGRPRRQPPRVRPFRRLPHRAFMTRAQSRSAGEGGPHVRFSLRASFALRDRRCRGDRASARGTCGGGTTCKRHVCQCGRDLFTAVQCDGRYDRGDDRRRRRQRKRELRRPRDRGKRLVRVHPGFVGFSATAGGTYYLLAFDDTPGPPNGGTLQISVSELQPSEAAVTVDPTGTVNPHTGVVTVSGTFTCANADFAFVDVTVTQKVGRFTISGFGEIFADPCDGQSHPWSVDVTGSNGRFAGGKANVDAFMFACGAIECATDETSQAIRLRPR